MSMKARKSVNAKGFWVVGARYFIRTVTMYLVGRLAYVDEHEIVLADASWIPETGRFHEAMRSGVFSEVEPYGAEVAVGRGAVVDAVVWTHDLPREAK